MPIRVLLVDDHSVVRCGLKIMLSSDPGIEVCGEAASAAEALLLLQQLTFDVMLLDLILPDRNGLDLLKHLRERYSSMAVLIVSAQPEKAYAIRAFRLGAAGYLGKDIEPATLVEAVQKVAAGGKHVSPSVLQKLAGVISGKETMAPHERLTDREMEIFRLLATGMSLVAIGMQLNVSPSTVTTYRARILEKTALKNNADITRYAVDHGLLG